MLRVILYLKLYICKIFIISHLDNICLISKFFEGFFHSFLHSIVLRLKFVTKSPGNIEVIEKITLS